MKQITQAGATFVTDLFRNNFPEQAERAAMQLLAVIDDSNTADFQEYLEHLRWTYKQHTYEDIQNDPPHVIATQALRLYDTGDTKQAWEWMRLAEKNIEKQEI